MRDHESMPSEPTNQPSRSPRFLPLGIIAGVSAIALLAGGGAAWWAWQSLRPNPQPLATSPEASIAPQSPAAVTPAEQTVQVYWLKTVGNQIKPTASPVSVAGEEPDAILNTAFEKMLQGSDDPELSSTIPAGTTLRAIDVKEDGVHVDLSQEFTTGGGSASMMGRLAQVIYTASTLDPSAPVWISVDGKPLDVLGGEGLIVDQPMTRESFEQNFTL